MKLRGIETTPNPNCMMLRVDEDFGSRPLTFTVGDADLGKAPEVAITLLAIDGVRSVFLSRDFITVTRRTGADWKAILEASGRLLGAADGEGDPAPAQQSRPADAPEPDRVDLAVLEFRGLPGQVRATTSEAQARVALPDRFARELARVLGVVSANYLAERRWRPLEARHGDPAEVARMVAEEIDSSLSDRDLTRIGEAAIAGSPEASVREKRSRDDLLADLSSAEPKVRLAAVQALRVEDSTFPAFVHALADENAAVRRWAAAVLGSSRRAEAVAPLCAVVGSDASIIVRRTAADALSDLGDPAAIPVMCAALTDRSPLVRWRAARYLNERGDQAAIGALEGAVATEPDFGIHVEMTAALERIRGGHPLQPPMWLRIARAARAE